jgi:uncharacterized protein (TIGR00369 family)
MTARKPIDRERLTALFDSVIPFNRFLGVRVTDLGDGVAQLELPFRTDFVGNPLLKTLHGGVISMLLDNCGGAAVWTQIGRNDLVSTVDLRVDYLRPGRPETLIGSGRVVRQGNRVGVVELRAFHPGGEDRPVAAGTGVYNIRRTRGDGNDMWDRLTGGESG